MISGQNGRLWRRHQRLSQRLCQRLSHRGERLCQRLSHGVERLCQRLSRLSRRLWRRATHGEAATGDPRDRTAGAWYSRRRIPRGTWTAASWQCTAQAAIHGAGENATQQGHKQRPQCKQDGVGIGIAPNIKTPYRRVKIANKAYSRKAAGIHREQKKTPHSVSHAGHGYFWSFARSSSSRTGCNRIYNRIKGDTSSRGNCSTYAGAGQAKVNRRVVVVLV